MPEEREKLPMGQSIEWFASAKDGGELGPLPQTEIEKMLASGKLTLDDLVWNTGMPDWLPVRKVPELATLAAPALPRQAGGTSFPSFTAASLTGPLSFLSRPLFFRTFGRIAALLALLVFLGSLALWYWGWTWFDGVLLLALTFFLGEAVGAVLERLDRLATSRATAAENGKTATDKE